MHLINPDSDDIFRKAAEEYPLKTDVGRWDSVQRKLEELEIDTQKKIVFYAGKLSTTFVLLIVPLGLLVPEQASIKWVSAIISANIVNSQSVTEANNAAGNVADYVRDKRTEVFQKSGNAYNNNLSSIGSFSADNSGIVPTSKTNIILQRQITAMPEKMIFTELSTSNLKSTFNKVNVGMDAPDKKLSCDQETISTSPTKGQKYRRFYIGGLIAPEVTNVNFQAVNKGSFNAGILLGYKIFPGFGIEIGGMLAHKYYYTTGKYIPPRSIRNDNSKILTVDAYNSITEVPLVLQCDLRSGNNYRVFAGAGGVSYIVHKEKYSYTYKKQQENRQGERLYNKSSYSWFSNLQCSIGYEHSLNKTSNVRIEPYYRIPLKGIGISDLPVTSIGINFALTKSF